MKAISATDGSERGLFTGIVHRESGVCMPNLSIPQSTAFPESGWNAEDLPKVVTEKPSQLDVRLLTIS